mmetsp:Transcript_28472/g.68475  ORF Transcript_28472/g.68475 Transcript_28472/m.68475 type:complete len:419 (-) Transcript_28472:26-1282(-)
MCWGPRLPCRWFRGLLVLAAGVGGTVEVYLSKLEVRGLLPTHKWEVLTLTPTFTAHPNVSSLEEGHFNYVCYLDYKMEEFSLSAVASSDAKISTFKQDGIDVPNAESLEAMSVKPGSQSVFSISVQRTKRVKYTLVVRRHAGESLEIHDLLVLSGKLMEPYHAGEMQAHLSVVQHMHEDFMDIEYIKADGGQNVTCTPVKAITVGPNPPHESEVFHHKHRYIPALEAFERVRQHEHYHPTRGVVGVCRIPIDTWRQMQVVIGVTSSDGTHSRHLHLNATRAGCHPGKFFHAGECITYCPNFHYSQRYNWRCGQCNLHCEFCSKGWFHCDHCQRDTPIEIYQRSDSQDGSCVAHRVHQYKVYYTLTIYLGYGCAILASLYTCLFLGWIVAKICDVDHPRKELRERSRPLAETSSSDEDP